MSENANPGDYWPPDGRYGVMCVEGYPAGVLSSDRNSRSGSNYGFCFWVVDLAEAAREIVCFKASGRSLDSERVQLARRKACREADTLNIHDRIDDRIPVAAD